MHTSGTLVLIPYGFRFLISFLQCQYEQHLCQYYIRVDFLLVRSPTRSIRSNNTNRLKIDDDNRSVHTALSYHTALTVGTHRSGMKNVDGNSIHSEV